MSDYKQHDLKFFFLENYNPNKYLINKNLSKYHEIIADKLYQILETEVDKAGILIINVKSLIHSNLVFQYFSV